MQKVCPACLEEGDTLLVEDLECCSIRQCAHCGLQYANGLPANVPVFQDFTEAGRAFLSRLKNGEGIETLLTPNERTVLHWLKCYVPSGAAVLELCCESGRFLAALRGFGLQPLGMDPLLTHISMLEREGFMVKAGSVEDYPGDWPQPAAVVLLESLVRFPAPVELLKTIRRRFPKAALCISVPSPRRSLKVPEFDRRVDYPPHHLTRWTPAALLTALEKAGYRGQCKVSHVDIRWRRGSFKKRVLKLLFASFLRLIGESQYSICVIGWPS